MKVLWALGVVLFLDVVSACSPSGAVTSDPQSPVPQTTGESFSNPATAQPDPAAATPQSQGTTTQDIAKAVSPRLYLLEGGIIARPLNNGAAVPMTKEISAEIYIAPYPPRFASRIDLYLFEPRSGRPITNAEVVINYEMLYMDHGLYKLNTFDNGNGHYQASLDFDMDGEWVVDVYAGGGEQSGSVRLEIVVAPP